MDWEHFFDTGAIRENTNSVKWDGREKLFGRKDALPLWVADMDFFSPDCVRKALAAEAEKGLWGYAFNFDEAIQAVCDWEKKRHAVTVKADQVLLSPGVVDSLGFSVNAYTKSGDKVAIMTPVYGPFLHVVENSGRIPCFVPLLNTRDGWKMDLDCLEEGLKQGVKLLLLCSPHNPVGRIWTEAELKEVFMLCERYGCRVVTDEIHADFEMPGYRHTSSMLMSENAVCLVSATKTFNLAGLRCSSMLFGSDQDKKVMERFLDSVGIGEVSTMGAVAQTAAYRGGEEWLNALLGYLDGTRKAAEAFARDHLPGFSFSRLEGTYLMWLDMRSAGLCQEKLEKKLIEEANVALSSGASFSAHGEGFMRVNIATPRANVIKALENIRKAFA